MTAHRLCTHAATSSARARCRRVGGPVRELHDALPAEERDARGTRLTSGYMASRRRIADAPAVSPIVIRDALDKAIARTEKLGINVPHTEAAKPEHMTDVDWHILLRNRARVSQSPWPTDDERNASLTQVWCGRCHLLHDSDAACVNAPARPTSTREVLDHAVANDVAVRKNDAARAATSDLPTFTNARARAASIPEGRYAVRDQAGDIKFYKIDKPIDGRWAGYVFLKALASDNEFPIKLAARQIAVFDAILEATPEASMALYGHSIGQCGRCGRTLTDPESIARGIGPVCAARCGW